MTKTRPRAPNPFILQVLKLAVVPGFQAAVQGWGSQLWGAGPVPAHSRSLTAANNSQPGASATLPLLIGNWPPHHWRGGGQAGQPYHTAPEAGSGWVLPAGDKWASLGPGSPGGASFCLIQARHVPKALGNRRERAGPHRVNLGLRPLWFGL